MTLDPYGTSELESWLALPWEFPADGPSHTHYFEIIDGD